MGVQGVIAVSRPVENQRQLMASACLTCQAPFRLRTSGSSARAMGAQAMEKRIAASNERFGRRFAIRFIRRYERG